MVLQYPRRLSLRGASPVAFLAPLPLFRPFFPLSACDSSRRFSEAICMSKPRRVKRETPSFQPSNSASPEPPDAAAAAADIDVRADGSDRPISSRTPQWQSTDSQSPKRRARSVSAAVESDAPFAEHFPDVNQEEQLLLDATDTQDLLGANEATELFPDPPGKGTHTTTESQEVNGQINDLAVEDNFHPIRTAETPSELPPHFSQGGHPLDDNIDDEPLDDEDGVGQVLSIGQGDPDDKIGLPHDLTEDPGLEEVAAPESSRARPLQNSSRELSSPRPVDGLQDDPKDSSLDSEHDLDFDPLPGSDMDPETATLSDVDPEGDEMQTAAKILSERGLLGLGVDGAKRTDADAVKNFALGDHSADEVSESDAPESAVTISQFDDDSDDVSATLQLPDELAADEDLSDEEEEDDLNDDTASDDIDDYPDIEDDEDFELTSQASFGKVWELNEDTYVTITEPGESYAYELDEDDEEDQEMASLRRGKHGGWSGGLTSYPASELPVGSREWVARRSYELMREASFTDMFRWTKKHLEPPESISSLYPSSSVQSTPLGKTTLKISTPPAAVTMIGKDSSYENKPANPVFEPKIPTADTLALQRSVKFPCQYKFKVERLGSVDESFVEDLHGLVSSVMDTKVEESVLQVENQGGSERIIIVVHVNSAVEVTQLYDALRNHPEVKSCYV